MAAVKELPKVRVKLNSSRAGHRFDAQGRQVGSYVQNVGDVVEVDEDEALRLFDAGLASPEQSKG